jgi:hypothetical protein
MKLQSGESVTVDILGSFEKLVWGVIVQVLWLLGFVAFVAVAPALYFFFGLFCARSGSADLPMIYVFTSPLPVAVWALFLCHWHSVRQWQREGRDLGVMGSNWREAHGGYAGTMSKSFVFMLAGGFFSWVAQMSAVALHWYITGRGVFFMPIYPTDPTPTDLTIFWSLMPLVAFSPVVVLLISRWIRRDNVPSNTHVVSSFY